MLANNTYGVVYPPQPLQPLPTKDAREYGLERLRDYICSLRFYRSNAPGQPPIPFALPETSVLIQQPDDLKDLPLPGIGIVPGNGTHEPFGLGPPSILDETEGVAGPGTALQLSGEYREQVVIEVWGSKKAERRALMAGLKTALRASDGSSAIYLTLPDYYDTTVGFELVESLYIDGDEVARNRRRGHIVVDMRVYELAVVNVRELIVSAHTTVLDGNVVLTLDSETL
jgi:hypothetical protein